MKHIPLIERWAEDKTPFSVIKPAPKGKSEPKAGSSPKPKPPVKK